MADTETSREATVTFKLNGTDVTVPKGWTVMQAVKRENVKVPHFCWHPGLSIAGVCRFCMVKVAGRPKLEIACNLQAVEGMEVNTTDDPKLVKFVVKEWWYRKNPTMLGMHTLRDIIDRYPERIKATNSHQQRCGLKTKTK